MVQKVFLLAFYIFILDVIFFSLIVIFCKDRIKKYSPRLFFIELITILLIFGLPNLITFVLRLFNITELSDKINLTAVVIYGLTLILTAIIAIFGESIKTWTRHPELELKFEVTFPSVNLTTIGGCEYTPITATNNNFGIDERIKDYLYWKTEVFFDCYFYRLKILNTGNIDALNVQIMLNNCEKYDDVLKKYLPLNNFLPMNLCWSYHDNDKRTSIEDRIAPKMEKYCDLVHIINDNKNEMIFDTLLWVDANKKASNIFKKGRYKIELMYGASNFPTKSKIIEFEYTGNWDDKIKQIKIISTI